MRHAVGLALLVGLGLLLAAFAADIALASGGCRPLLYRVSMEDPAGEGVYYSSAFYVIRTTPEGYSVRFKIAGSWLACPLLLAVLGGLLAYETGAALPGCWLAAAALALAIAFFPSGDKNLPGLAVTDFAAPLCLTYALGRRIEDKARPR